MSRLIALLAFAVLSVVSNACERVPLLAPTGSTIQLTLGDTTNVGLNSSMQVSAIVTESGGTPPHNGTVVTFTTTLGHVDPVEARTTNGRASTTFYTGNRSGTATLRAFSGAAGTGESEATADVLIGGASEGIVVELRVEGTSNNGTNTNLVAHVSDGVGNSVTGVSVSFTTDVGRLTRGLETTDANGDARTTLISIETAEVTASVGAASDTITITMPGTLELAVTSPAPGTPAEVGQVVTFTLTPSPDSVFNDVVVNFGDGQTQSLGRVTIARTFQHTFNQRGTYTVTATGTTATGAPAQASAIVQVNDRIALSVTLAANPATVSLASGGQVTFTATPQFPTGIGLSRTSWTFGDGGTAPNVTSLSATHRYTAAGTYNVTVTVTANDGRQGSAAIAVTVTP